MNRSAKKGAYWKARTKKWLLAKGWTQIVDMEVVHRIGLKFAVKRDQMGSDLMVVGSTLVVFIQVKGGKSAVGNGTYPQARREFAKFTWPSCTSRWIVAWPPRAREPRVIYVDVDGSVS